MLHSANYVHSEASPLNVPSPAYWLRSYIVHRIPIRWKRVSYL